MRPVPPARTRARADRIPRRASGLPPPECRAPAARHSLCNVGVDPMTRLTRTTLLALALGLGALSFLTAAEGVQGYDPQLAPRVEQLRAELHQQGR